MSDEQKFYELLFGYAEGQIVGWNPADGKSRWLQDHEALYKWVKSRRGHDVYISCLTRDPDMPENLWDRGTASQTYELCALWADIDFKHPVHKKEANLPPDEEALAFIKNEFPLAPTFIVHSGHGYQVWWMLKEPYTITDANERRFVESITYGWQAQIRRLIGDRKWVIDSVADLARVMRAPGSLNYKAVNKLGEKEPKPVRIIEANYKNIYDVSEFEPYLSEEASDLPVEVAHIDFDPSVSIVSDKIDQLCQIDKDFDGWWKSKSGAPPKDPSQSGWDLRMANIAVRAGFTDQEVADMLINFRRKHGEDMKYPGYYQRTIAKAKVSLASDRRSEEQEEAMHGLQASQLGEGSTERDKIRENLSRVLGVEISRLIKFVSTPAEYRLVLADGRSIRIPSTRQLIRASDFQVIMAELAQTYVVFERKEWPVIASNLLAIAEEEHAGDEAVDLTETKTLIAGFLAARNIASSWEEAKPDEDIKEIRPFEQDGKIYVYGKDFLTWCDTSAHIKMTSRQMGLRFREIGGEPDKFNFNNTSAAVWAFDTEIIDPYYHGFSAGTRKLPIRSEAS